MLIKIKMDNSSYEESVFSNIHFHSNIELFLLQLRIFLNFQDFNIRCCNNIFNSNLSVTFLQYNSSDYYRNNF
jgi:hypothetical protein